MFKLNFIKKNTFLITGGTGSFGNTMVKKLLERGAPEVRILSRDEKKQEDMRIKLKNKKVKFYIGDVRNYESVYEAMKGVHFVFHAAALKQVPAAEYNPFEFIKTNVIGTQNLVESCLDKGVNKVIALSTDKASSPINLYGATKLCSDKLILSANNIKGKKKITFSENFITFFRLWNWAILGERNR